MPKAKISKRRAINVAFLPAPTPRNQQSSTPRAVNATSPSLLRVRVRGIARSAGSPRRNGQFGGPEVASANHRQRYWSSASGGDTTIVLGHKSQSAIV
jgi:hypothetical protein